MWGKSERTKESRREKQCKADIFLLLHYSLSWKAIKGAASTTQNPADLLHVENFSLKFRDICYEIWVIKYFFSIIIAQHNQSKLDRSITWTKLHDTSWAVFTSFWTLEHKNACVVLTRGQHDMTAQRGTALAPQCFISIQMLLLSSLQLNCFDREIPHKFGMNKLAWDLAVNIW